jgi:large subunit ribosomal protein L25
MSFKVKVESRNVMTASELRKMREQGLVPASVSGKQISPVSIAIDEKELHQLLRNHANEVLEMELPQQGSKNVVLQEVQRDKLIPGKLLHVDFHQISMTEPVKMVVPIEWVGDAPGVSEGGMLTHLLSELEIKALPNHLPTEISVNVSTLGIGDKLIVEDLIMPQGVECLIDPETAVVTVLQVRKLTDAEEEVMNAEADGKGGLKEHSGAKVTESANVE